jgi:acetyl esterase/lipase
LIAEEKGARTTHGTVHSAIALTVTPADGLVDGPLHIRLEGLSTHAAVSLHACLRDPNGTRWTSHADFISKADGTIDVSTDAPIAGAYSGVDGEGLITSSTVDDATAARPFDSNSIQPLAIDFTATVGGRSVGHTTICRRYVATGVRTVAVRERGLAGLLFRPDTSDARPAVLVLGGSEGGLLFAAQTAALLASHGMVSLALAYFRFEQLPPHLVEIPLEYFETALQWLSAQPGVKPDALAVVGRSRGAELALLLGSRLSSLRSMVAYCPSSVTWNGLRGERLADSPAWTAAGRGISFASLSALTPPQLRARTFGRTPVRLSPLFETALAGPLARDAFIPVERGRGSILLISGDDDGMWPSGVMGDQIVARLGEHRYPFPFRHCRYPGAGHLMRPPGVPTSVLAGAFELGGIGAMQARANRAAWSETLTFLGAR